MSGNIWEWTRSLWGEDLYNAGFGYPYDPMDGREDLMAGTNVLRVLRGGSFLSNGRNVRAAVRLWYGPVNGRRSLGFRVVMVGVASI
jgi:iron(II)-dependent oxidoreductase